MLYQSKFQISSSKLRFILIDVIYPHILKMKPKEKKFELASEYLQKAAQLHSEDNTKIQLLRGTTFYSYFLCLLVCLYRSLTQSLLCIKSQNFLSFGRVREVCSTLWECPEKIVPKFWSFVPPWMCVCKTRAFR